MRMYGKLAVCVLSAAALALACPPPAGEPPGAAYGSLFSLFEPLKAAPLRARSGGFGRIVTVAEDAAAQAEKLESLMRSWRVAEYRIDIGGRALVCSGRYEGQAFTVGLTSRRAWLLPLRLLECDARIDARTVTADTLPRQEAFIRAIFRKFAIKPFFTTCLEGGVDGKLRNDTLESLLNGLTETEFYAERDGRYTGYRVRLPEAAGDAKERELSLVHYYDTTRGRSVVIAGAPLIAVDY